MVDAIAGTLFTATAFLGAIARSEALILSEEEARKLTNAAMVVADQYESVGVDPRTLAWVNFGVVAGGIVGPRVLMYMSERAQRRAEAAKKAQPMQPQGANIQGLSVVKPN